MPRHGVTKIALAIIFVSGMMAAVQAQPLTNPLPLPIPVGAVRVGLETVATGLVAPNWGTAPTGDTGRLFVSDQNGILWVIDLSTFTKTVFLDVSARLIAPNAGSERGLLGVAFHPSYFINGFFYTYTSEPATVVADFPVPGDAPPDHQSVVTEWRVNAPGDRAAVADPLSGRVLLRVNQPQANHNAGALAFGRDGMLYIALGDGGNADDQGPGHSPQGNGQDTSNVLGSILRIDPVGGNSLNGQYGVPSDNPFFPLGAPPFGGQGGCLDGICDEIFAYGFRNPFRISFDKRTDVLYAGDVGQGSIEEVNIVVRGGNYGWRIREGTFCFDPNGDAPGVVTAQRVCGPRSLRKPVAQYDHDEGVAVIGGFVYRGLGIPALRGRYVFGDFLRPGAGEGRLFVLKKPKRARPARLTKRGIEELGLVGGAGLGLLLLGFGQDAQGELYVLGIETGGTGAPTGVVLRMVRSTP